MMRFNPPPHWPSPPPDWEPEPGWRPPPDWTIPPGWKLWIEDHPAPEAQPHEPPIGDRAEAPDAREKVPFFGARKHAAQLAEQVSQLESMLARVGGMDAAQVAEATSSLRADQARLKAKFDTEMKVQTEQRTAVALELQHLRDEIVRTQDEAILQEVGVYQYSHPLQDAVAFKDRLARVQREISAMARADGGAVQSATNWQVNDSLAEGRKMIKDFSKLMLRAYNAEADTLVRGLKPYRLEAAVDRLHKTVLTIERLGKTMNIRISQRYHDIRLEELRLTADYQARVAEEKEAEREEKVRLREERLVRQEAEREKARLEKERAHYANALSAMRATDDQAAIERLAAQLADVDRAIADVDYRTANQRAGYVYVISNVGAFGEKMIKVGMTRRLEPMDRIRELSDASVPFNFDVHALFFADDAVGIEQAMHKALAQRRVNQVNMRREYFYATVQEAKLLLADLAGDLLHFEEVPEALEYRQSLNARQVSDQGATVQS